MFRFLLFMKGYYSILVSGYGAERFINLCKVKNIYLWDLQMSHNEFCMKIAKADYESLDEIVNKTGVKVDILQKYGLPFLLMGKNNRIFYIKKVKCSKNFIEIRWLYKNYYGIIIPNIVQKRGFYVSNVIFADREYQQFYV